jgi:hypothetical protein
MINKDFKLLQNRTVPNNTGCGSPVIQTQCAQFIAEIQNACVNGVAQLPINSGFEKHPYKGMLQNIESEKYLIGTFPPISYIIDSIQSLGTNIQNLRQPTNPHQVITKPMIPFFHGNVGSLWSVFLTQPELAALNALLPGNRIGGKNFLIEKLHNIGVFYDDIIKSTQRKLGKVDQNIQNLGYTYEDKNLKNICVDEELIIRLVTNQNTKVVCFTNGATFGVNGLQLYTQLNRAGLVKTNNSDALSLFLRGCQDMGLNIELQCLPHYTWTPLAALNQAQRSTKLIFEVRISKGRKCNHISLVDFDQKSFTTITPFSPAAIRFMGNHPIVANYLDNNGNPPIASMLTYVYDKFRNNQHALLYPLNI